MNDLQRQTDSLTEDFGDDLEKHGFIRADPTAWLGSLDIDGVPKKIRISVDDQWPFWPPKVAPADDEFQPARSWHREPRGALCLYADNQQTGMPWLNVEHLLDRAAQWFKHDAEGGRTTNPGSTSTGTSRGPIQKRSSS